MDLFRAIRTDDVEAFFSGLADCDLNRKDEFGESLLHVAIGYGRNEFALELLNRGIDCNFQDPEGATPLHWAAERKNCAIAEKILSSGGRLDICDRHGNQPLWTAVFNARGDYNVVALFLAQGANTNHVNKAGRSPASLVEAIGDDALLALVRARR